MRLAAQEKHTCSWRPEQTKPQEEEKKKKMKVGIKNGGEKKKNRQVIRDANKAGRQAVS